MRGERLCPHARNERERAFFFMVAARLVHSWRDTASTLCFANWSTTSIDLRGHGDSDHVEPSTTSIVRKQDLTRGGGRRCVRFTLRTKWALRGPQAT